MSILSGEDVASPSNLSLLALFNGNDNYENLKSQLSGMFKELFAVESFVDGDQYERCHL
jgi:hypothetical protein